MSKEDATVGVVPPTYDSEKGTHTAVGNGLVNETNRESDFRTRNGLNLESFKRRELSPCWPPRGPPGYGVLTIYR